MTVSTSIHDIKTLILSFHPVIAIETVEEERVESLLEAVASQLRLPLYQWTITGGLVKFTNTPVLHGTTKPEVLLENLKKFKIEGIFLLKDFDDYLKNSSLSRQFREVMHQFTQNHSTMILTGTSINLPAEVNHSVVHYDLQLPEIPELYLVFRSIVQSLKVKHRIKVQLSSQDLNQLLRALSGMTLNQARQVLAYAALVDGKLFPGDIKRVLERKAQMIREGGLLEYYPEEDNCYELGGFIGLKQWLRKAKVGFTKEAKSLNLNPPKGILLVGIQGCGKSLSAKAIAREWQLPLLKLDAGRLYDKYIGESEKNFRQAIKLAESMSPVVLWIDEIEKAFSGGSDSQADGGLSRRLFGSFLTWLQEKREEVFVVATANDISTLPPEFLRKGRFDEIFFVDLPTAEERQEIFKIHLSLRKQDITKFHLEKLILISDGYSGAEIEQSVISALYQSLYLKQPLTTELLLAEIQQMIPLSVSRKEDIERLKKLASDRFLSVR
ncbi:MAG: AAA family ATPase [Chroococcales cyanobacterium]